MAYLGNPTSTVAVLKKYNLHFRKQYGQNFLIDSNILEKIVASAQLTKEDTVLEIGPGIGTMTQYLAERAGRVIAVEIDKTLIPVLEDTLSVYDNVEIINRDILKTDQAALAEVKNGGKPFQVVANLPYYITTPIIMGLFESRIPPQRMTIMIQKEVADRMQAQPGSKDYGSLSLAVQYHAFPEIVMQVSPSCFMPRPNVGSTVIRLTGYKEKPVQAEDEAHLFTVIRAAFGQRRKTLVNSLMNAENLRVTKEQILQALERLGIDPMVRGEALTLEMFAELAKYV